MLLATIERFQRMHFVTITEDGKFVDGATMFSLISARQFAISFGVDPSNIEVISL